MCVLQVFGKPSTTLASHQLMPKRCKFFFTFFLLQVLGEPRAREMLPPQMSAEYVRKLLDVFRVSAIFRSCSLLCTCCVLANGMRLRLHACHVSTWTRIFAPDMYRPQMSLYTVCDSILSHSGLSLQAEQRIIRSPWLQSTSCAKHSPCQASADKIHCCTQCRKTYSWFCCIACSSTSCWQMI